MPTTILDGETYQEALNRRYREEAETYSAKRTPGPWYVNTNGSLSEYAVCAEVFGSGFSSSVAVAMQRDNKARNPISPDEALANAILIAAAPETAAERDRLKEINAELLDSANAALDAMTDERADAEYKKMAVSLLRASIANATGGEK